MTSRRLSEQVVMFSAGEVPYLKISINHATIRDIDIASQEVAFDAVVSS